MLFNVVEVNYKLNNRRRENCFKDVGDRILKERRVFTGEVVIEMVELYSNFARYSICWKLRKLVSLRINTKLKFLSQIKILVKYLTEYSPTIPYLKFGFIFLILARKVNSLLRAALRKSPIV